MVTPADNFFANIIAILNVYVVNIVISIAFIVFFWGVYKYFVQGAADEKERQKGRQLVLYGILGFVIMVSVWGLVNLVMGTFGLQNETRPSIPSSRDSSGSAGQQGSSILPPATCNPQCSAGSVCVSGVCQTQI